VNQKKNRKIKEKSLKNKSSAVAEMGHTLATTDIGRKVGAAVPPPFLGWGWVSI